MSIAELLSDERVRELVTQAMHAETALSFDISEKTKRRAVENLRKALEPFCQELARRWAENRSSCP
jgi:hypothetical protein